MRIPLLIVLSLIGFGCGAHPTLQQENMSPANLTVSNRYGGSVTVIAALQKDVSGSRFWTASNIASNPDSVAEAVRKAAKKFAVFSEVKPNGQSNYLLQIDITNVDEPAFGANFDAELDAHWTLTSAASAKVLWDANIVGRGRAESAEAAVGWDRARIAEERAVANHVKIGLETLSRNYAETSGR